MVEDYIQIIENSISKIGLSPEETRGEEAGQWQLFRGSVGLFLDVWKPSVNSDWNYTGTEQAVNTFQVIAPITELPDQDKIFKFYEEALHMNFHMYNASLIINSRDNVLAVKYKRIIAGITESEVIEAIESVGYYAEMLAEYFSKNYEVKKLSE